MKGWTNVTLGDLCEFRRGLTYKKSDEVASSRNGVLRANNITVETGEINHDEIRFIRDEIDIPDSKKVADDCLLVCTASGSKKHLGKIALIENESDYAFGGFMGLLVPSERALPKYLFWLTRSYLYADFIEGLSDGVNINNLKWSQLSQFAVPLPPLPEQERIVAILDEAFAAIATATANAEKNLANARELFESYLSFGLRDVASQEPTQTLSDITDLIVDCEHKTAPTQDSGYPSIRTPNIGKGHLILEDVNRVSEDTYKLWTKREEPRPGDLILAREAPAGNFGVIPAGERVCLGQRTVLIRPTADVADSQFLAFMLLHAVLQQRLLASSTGATVEHVNMRDIRALRIGNLPLIGDQRETAKQVLLAQAKSERLASLANQKLDLLVELKQTIRHKAFSGELTAGIAAPATIPFPATIEGISTTDLHAGILAIAHRAHEANDRLGHFGRVKGEKIAHLVEACVGVDLGRTPVKDAAGPNDYPHLKRVEHRARMAGFFSVRRLSERYELTPKGGFDGLIERASGALGERLKAVEDLIALMLPMTTQQSEIFATVYAAWNNLLLDGTEPSDDAIVREAREDWHRDKLRIPRYKFLNAIKWIRDNDLVPKGVGKKVREGRRRRA